uniref:Uncharacterized protein n=1 Tax=Rhizophora mucronata TaxID=61149 RepID=A0A2P2LMY3_RHIMU
MFLVKALAVNSPRPGEAAMSVVHSSPCLVPSQLLLPNCVFAFAFRFAYSLAVNFRFLICN